MKNLLVLALVLAVTSFAAAVPVWTITDVGGAVTISVAASDARDLYLALTVDSGAVLSSIAKGANAPSDSMSAGSLASNAVVLPGETGEVWAMADFSSPYTYGAGTWLTATRTGSPTTIRLYEVDENSGTAPLASLYIPEPATIAILSLGGLLLRRKK